jgi:hypothetical protein
MIPMGGVNFNGGAGGGNTLLLGGTAGDDIATLTTAQFSLAGFSPIPFSNVASFGYYSDSGADVLTLDHVAVNCDRDNAFSSNTSVALNGGTLNFNGHSAAVGNLAVTDGGQVSAAGVSGTSISVAGGTLTAASIVADTLTIGSSHAAAARASSLGRLHDAALAELTSLANGLVGSQSLAD